MKVLFVSHMFPNPARPMYGTFVRDYADAIRREGVEVEVLHLATRLPWPLNRAARYRATGAGAAGDPAGVTSIPFPVLPGLFAFDAYSFRARHEITRAASRIGKVDLIHAHNLFPDAALALETKRTLNARLVVTTHGTDNRVHIHRVNRRRHIERALSETDHLIAVSGKILREFNNAGIRPTQASVIYNGFQKLETPVTMPKREGRTALCVCHLDLIEKGVDILIEAFGRVKAKSGFKDCRLIIVGSGNNATKLKALAQSVGVADATEFTGALAPAQVHEEFARCDFFCMPSWYEAFGVVYLEAMSHGKPVVAVKGQGIAEILRDGETGLLIEPRDVESCARALETLFRDGALRTRLGAAGKKLASQFTWQRAAAQTIAIYSELLSATQK